jgi:hypothetical protein
MDNKISFTAYLKDEYSKKFEKIADMTDDAVKEMVKDLDKLGGAGKKAARSMDMLEKEIAQLTKVKKLSLNTDTIKHAEAEIKRLRGEMNNLGGAAPSVKTGGGWLGGMGSGFAITGGLLAAGAILKNVGSEAIDATAKYQKFEAVLANTLGSTGAAKSKMLELQEFSTKTPFQVDELTDSFVKLANMGFKPTMAQMTMLGDLAASRGKGMDQLAEAVIDAQTGEFERLKEFGIKARQEGDKVTFMFNDKKTTVANTSSAIRDYILAMGSAAGVTGSMAAISKTTGGQISNLKDNIDLTYKALGDRFRPEIDASIAIMNSMVASVKSWVEIPMSEKTQEEIDKLQKLHVELTLANTGETRRKEILKELESINPRIVEGIDKESVSYEQLAKNIGLVVNALSNKKIAERVMEENGDFIGAYNTYKGQLEDINKNQIPQMLAKVGDQRLLNPELSSGQRQILAQRILMDRFKNGTQREGDDVLLANFKQNVGITRRGTDYINANQGRMQGIQQQIQDGQKIYGDMFGTGEAAVPGGTKPGAAGGGGGAGAGSGLGRGSSSSSNMGSISGGAKVTHLNISIGNLVNGGFTIQTSTMKESPAQIKDLVLNALMTAVNDVNLVATN